MRLIFLAVLTWLACFTNGNFAQEQLMSLEYFDEKKGFNTTGFFNIIQDRIGFLWVASPDGLVRFDGYTFKHFRHVPGDSASISSNNVYCIAEDQEGNIWAGLIRGGVSCYNRATGKFRNYRFTEKLKQKTASVFSIFFDRQGEIWLGVSASGLVKLDKKTGNFQRFDLVTAQSAPHWSAEELPSHNTAYSFWQDENGILWCGTSDDLYRFDPKTGQALPQRTGKIEAGKPHHFSAERLFHDGEYLWVGGWTSGLRRFDRKTGEWKQYFFAHSENPISWVNIVTSIAAKNQDELWVATQDRGLGIFNKKTQRFFFFAHDTNEFPDLPKTDVASFLQDRQGNLWLNHKQNLVRIQLKNRWFQFFALPPSQSFTQPPPSITDLLDDREKRFRFVSTYGGDGFVALDKKTGRKVVPTFVDTRSTADLKQSVVQILQARNGAIWVLGRNLLYLFNKKTLQFDLPPQPPVFSKEYNSNLYTQMAEDLQGNIWLGTSLNGVFRYDPRTGKSAHFMPDEKKAGAIATHIVGSIIVDGQGRTWYGSRNQTAYGYYLPDENRFEYLDANGKVTLERASLRMNSFFTDEAGDVWACTEQGLLHFDCAGDRPRLRKKYTSADGLPTDDVAFAAGDDNGFLWLALNRRLCRLDKKTGKIITFGKRDGHPQIVTGIGKLDGGIMFLTSENGYHTFDPARLKPEKSTAPIVLSSFKVNDQERYHGSEARPSQPFIVPAGSRFFSLEYAALDLGAPEVFQYEYQLSGFDNQWINAGTRRNVTFTNIPAGQYQFKVKPAGAPDKEALSIPLTVKVAFYEKTWFWALLLAALAGTGLSIYRNRLREKQKLAALESKAQLLEKEKAVVMYESLKQQLNPHFLFNSLTSLGSLIQIDPKAAVGFLENLSKTYRYILKSSEREVVPLADELKFAESFVRLQKTRFEAGFEVRFQVPDEVFHRKIVPVTLQNLLENAIKHNIIDEESPLVVAVFVEDDYLVVRNNLQRKKFVETSNRKGMAHLQSFYKYLSEREIEMGEEEGFFTVRVPLI